MLRSVQVKEGDVFRHKVHRILLFGLNKDAARRIALLDFMLEPFHKPISPQTVVLWKDMDDRLKRWFLLDKSSGSQTSSPLIFTTIRSNRPAGSSAPYHQRHPRVVTHDIAQFRLRSLEDPRKRICYHLRIGSVLCALRHLCAPPRHSRCIC